jgi:hypothetical protein
VRVTRQQPRAIIAANALPAMAVPKSNAESGAGSPVHRADECRTDAPATGLWKRNRSRFFRSTPDRKRVESERDGARRFSYCGNVGDEGKGYNGMYAKHGVITIFWRTPVCFRLRAPCAAHKRVGSGTLRAQRAFSRDAARQQRSGRRPAPPFPRGAGSGIPDPYP